VTVSYVVTCARRPFRCDYAFAVSPLDDQVTVSTSFVGFLGRVSFVSFVIS